MRKLVGLVGVALLCSVSAAAAQGLVAAPAPAPAMSTGAPCLLAGPARQVAPDGAKTCMACGVAGGQQIRKTWTCSNGSWGSTAKCAAADPCNASAAAAPKAKHVRRQVAR